MKVDNKNLLSILIPCYNEEKTLEECIDRVKKIDDKNLPVEIIIIDDCSTDSSYKIAKETARKNKNIKLEKHKTNQGKGAALRTGFALASGNYIAIQDADLEYDPQELKSLVSLLVEDRADVVLGSRFISGEERRVLYFWHSLGNKFLTLLSNIFTNLNLSDMETCYKIFKKEIIEKINIEENRFGFEPEIIAKISEIKDVRIYEKGISYYGRSYSEGKKITYKDGFKAIYCILKYNRSKMPLVFQLFIYLPVFLVSYAVQLFFLKLYPGLLDNFILSTLIFFLSSTINYILAKNILLSSNKSKVIQLPVFYAVLGLSYLGYFYSDLLFSFLYEFKHYSLIIKFFFEFQLLRMFTFPSKK
ncbi:MAG: glycosyltransferase family 2 protein [bacterium]|nr:glycosyltransferase family 2 protein [bacterium]